MAKKLVLGIFLLVAILSLSTTAYRCGDPRNPGVCCSPWDCHWRLDETTEYCEWYGGVCCAEGYCAEGIDYK